MTFPFPFFSPGSEIRYTYQGVQSNGTDATVYNFTSFNIGTAAADRKILVPVGYGDGSFSATVSSVTVNGVSAAALAGTYVRSYVSNVEFWIASVPTGTTGVTINVTMSAAVARVVAGAYALYGSASTASDTQTSIASPLSFSSLAVPAGAGVFAVAYKFGGTTGFTWTGLTEDNDTAIEGDTCSMASSMTPGGTSGRCRIDWACITKE